MTKKKGSRYTPPTRRTIHPGNSPADLAKTFDLLGVPQPLAQPRSGWCMACGAKLVPPPDGPDVDHSVCHACFPPEMADWEGREVDHTTVDLDAGTVRALVAPIDPDWEPKETLPVGAFDWWSQSRQHPRNAPGPGAQIVYTRESLSNPREWVDTLLYYDTDGVLAGILYHYPFDMIVDDIFPSFPVVAERAGNANVFVHPARWRRGIATRLCDEAIARFALDLTRQSYTAAGVAFVKAYLAR